WRRGHNFRRKMDAFWAPQPESRARADAQEGVANPHAAHANFRTRHRGGGMINAAVRKSAELSRQDCWNPSSTACVEARVVTRACNESRTKRAQNVARSGWRARQETF